MRTIRHWDAAMPSATLGRVFTASIGQETLVNGGAFLDHLSIGYHCGITTGAVTIESAIDNLALFTLRYGADTAIQLDGNDLIALSAFYYGQLPTIHENTDATGDNFVGAIKVPVQRKSDPSKPFSMSADFLAVTNTGDQTLSVTGYWLDQDYGRKPVHAVVVTETSAGATGADLRNWRIPPIGRLVGLIGAMPAASDMGEGNQSLSFNRVNLVVDGEVQIELNTLNDNLPTEESEYLTKLPIGDLIHRYKRFDLRPEGLELVGKVVNIQIDNEDASDALRWIPVIELGA